jgi:hypothetical protein
MGPHTITHAAVVTSGASGGTEDLQTLIAAHDLSSRETRSVPTDSRYINQFSEWHTPSLVNISFTTRTIYLHLL